VAVPRVIGVGRHERGDDAAGRLVARRLRERLGPDADVQECEGGAAELMDAWRGARQVVVVDAACSGARPGTLHRFDGADGPPPAIFRAASTHALGVAEAVALARALGELPAALVVYGIEGARFEPGAPPSPEVAAAVEALAARLGAEIEAAQKSP
jgi:hydrogenase maturation protease